MNLRTALSILSEVSGLLPSRDDHILQKITSCAAIYLKAEEIIQGGKGDPVQTFVREHRLERMVSEPLVSLLFECGRIADEKRTRRIEFTKHEEGIDVRADAGRVLFTRSTYGEGHLNATFYRSESFDPKEAVHNVWAQYDGRLEVTIATADYGMRTKTSYSTFPASRNPLLAGYRQRLDELVERHRRFQVDGVSRSYGFVGPPGVGKSTFADALAERIGTRLLRISAESFGRVSSAELTTLFDALDPDFLVVDDIDKTREASVPRFLSTMERFKANHPRTTLVLTANSTKDLDRGFLRPGRIDEWIEFALPGPEERREIIEGYGACVSDAVIDATDTLSHDYLREIAARLRRESEENVLGAVAVMKRLLGSEKK